MTPSRVSEPAWPHAAVLVSAAAALLWWTWGSWPDVLVDFGRELYVPWRIVEGDRLYADLAYFNGPFSPYLNALWFSLFGVGLRTLVWCNIALTGAFILLLHRLLSELGSRWLATWSCVMFLGLFSVAQLVEIGNYNFITPYSHEVTHGLLLSMLVMWSLLRYRHTQRTPWLATAGALDGLIFLTKPELGVAIYPATVVGLALIWRLALDRDQPRRRDIAVLCGAFAAPVVAAWAALAVVTTPGTATQGVLGSWPRIFDQRVTGLYFYRRMLGTDDIGRSLALMAVWSAVWGGILLAAGWVDGALRRLSPTARRRAGLAGFAAAVFVLCSQWAPPMWGGSTRDLARAWPVFMACIAAWSGLAALRGNPRESARAMLRAVWAVFALLLLAKMALNVHLYHYGFALAAPATVLAVMVSHQWAHTVARRRGGSGEISRLLLLGVWMSILITNLQTTAWWRSQQTESVGQGADRFKADWRGRLVNGMLQQLEERAGPGQTVLTMPEGAMVNYLGRRRNPSPYINFMPPEVLMFGEDRMLAALKRHPPEYVVFIDKDTAEYGIGLFGIGYARALGDWLSAQYRLVFEAEEVEPIGGWRMTARLLERAKSIDPQTEFR